MTVVDDRPETAAPAPRRRPNRLLALLRNSWRQLTSMRTALVLLFLLAVAAIPGSVLPQRGVSPEKVNEYFVDHPDWAPRLDRIGAFEVFGSVWFSAIYLLLFTSLIGCIMPRLRDHVRALRSRPPAAPKRLDRLPQHTVLPRPARRRRRRSRELLRKRRWRRRACAATTVSAEKGYLKETGNLLFHTSLIAVLIGVALGSWYGWHGNRLLVAGADNAFCNTRQQYAEAKLGPQVDSADLPPLLPAAGRLRGPVPGVRPAGVLQRHGDRRRAGRADPQRRLLGQLAAAAGRRERLPARPRVRPGDALHRPVRQQPDQRRRRS